MAERRLIVEGRHSLSGVVKPSGNSNSAISLILAGLLSSRRVKLINVPDTVRVQTFLDIARQIGAEAIKHVDGVYSLHLQQLSTNVIDEHAMQTAWYSFLLLAPILLHDDAARIELAFPVSRISTHISMLRDLGCHVTVSGNMVEVNKAEMAPGAVWLEETSVTATVLAVLLAAQMPGVTTIYNAASEPNVLDLTECLRNAGITITGMGSNLLDVTGQSRIEAKDFVVSLDVIEAANWLGVAAVTNSELSIEMPNGRMQMILRKFRQLGLNIHQKKDHLVYSPSTLEVVEDYDAPLREIKSAPWPGFPSDLVAMATVIATQAEGSVLLHETLYDNRMFFVDKLKLMGALITLCDPHRAIVARPPSTLYGSFIESPDVRAGFALLAAALSAKGTTVFGFPAQLQRVFEDTIPKLQGIGAKINWTEGNS